MSKVAQLTAIPTAQHPHIALLVRADKSVRMGVGEGGAKNRSQAAVGCAGGVELVVDGSHGHRPATSINGVGI